MKKVKFFIFAATSLMLSILLMVTVILAIEVYLHKKFEKYAGLNYKGYRGPVLKQKQPGEKRLIVLGGSQAFGYGVTWKESFPAYLERKLNAKRSQANQPPVTVANCAYNNQGAYSFKYTLEDYQYLNYDVVISFLWRKP